MLEVRSVPGESNLGPTQRCALFRCVKWGGVLGGGQGRKLFQSPGIVPRLSSSEIILGLRAYRASGMFWIDYR